MKYAIFSDIHGNLPALKAILADANKQNISNIICLGDVVGMGPKPKQCLDLIINSNVQMVLGNHELYFVYGTQIDDEMSLNEIAHQKWIASNLSEHHKEYLKNCPLVITKNIGDKVVNFQHFLIENYNQGVYPFADFNVISNGEVNNILKGLSADLVFVGHQHKPFNVLTNSKQLVDAGSSGCVGGNITHYVVLSEENGKVTHEIKQVVFNRDKLIADLNETDYPERNIVSKIFFGHEIKGN